MLAQAGGQGEFSNWFLESCFVGGGGNLLNCTEQTHGIGEHLPVQG